VYQQQQVIVSWPRLIPTLRRQRKGLKAVGLARIERLSASFFSRRQRGRRLGVLYAVSNAVGHIANARQRSATAVTYGGDEEIGRGDR